MRDLNLDSSYRRVNAIITWIYAWSFLQYLAAPRNRMTHTLWENIYIYILLVIPIVLRKKKWISCLVHPNLLGFLWIQWEFQIFSLLVANNLKVYVHLDPYQILLLWKSRFPFKNVDIYIRTTWEIFWKWQFYP